MNKPEPIKCACGCGRIVKWSGIGRPPKYYSQTCRNRAYRARVSILLKELRQTQRNLSI
jgi:hypothetical protein